MDWKQRKDGLMDRQDHYELTVHSYVDTGLGKRVRRVVRREQGVDLLALLEDAIQIARALRAEGDAESAVRVNIIGEDGPWNVLQLSLEELALSESMRDQTPGETAPSPAE